MSIYFLLLVLLGAWYLYLMVWLIRHAVLRGGGERWRALRDHGVVCGGCGYPIEPRTGARCSECGTLLVDAGLATPKIVVAYGPPLLTIGIALVPLFFGVGLLLNVGMARVANFVQWNAWRVDSIQTSASANPWRTTDGSNPQPGPDRTVRFYPAPGYSFGVEFKGIVPADAGDRRPRRGEITISVQGDAIQDHVLNYTVQSQAWSLMDPAGGVVERGSDIEAGIRSMFQASGITQQAQFAPEELEDAVAIGTLAVQTADFSQLWQPRTDERAHFNARSAGSAAPQSEPRGLRGFSRRGGSWSPYSTLGAAPGRTAAITLTVLLFCMSLWGIARARRKVLSRHRERLLNEKAQAMPQSAEG